jgi:hypothetical protein
MTSDSSLTGSSLSDSRSSDFAPLDHNVSVPKRSSYEISISGRLGDLASAFAPYPVLESGALSFVRAVDVDQSTLFGVIALVQELGLELREVRRV